MARKRTGEGGNASKDPRGNLAAQEAYIEKFGRDTKRCTGFLHHDAGEISVYQFRQQKSNSNTFLQSRCDLCNRLYFSIIQKPAKKIAAISIWAEFSGDYDWRNDSPSTLVEGIEAVVEYWRRNPCAVEGCSYPHHHSSYRFAARCLTDSWRDRDKEQRISRVVDRRSGQEHPAPQFMHDLQSWAGAEGALWSQVDTKDIWRWWCSQFPEDTATCSAERSAVARGEMSLPVPDHPLDDFSWGSGNILETTQGHSVPGFNQVRAAVRELPVGSSVSGRVYGYLCEGDHLAMRAFSERCKAEGLSLGHSPAPLRWLGKDDPVNAEGQDLRRNSELGDSLSTLHEAAVRNPERAGEYVSWQIRALVVELGRRRSSCEEFTQRVQAEVEKYFDELQAAVTAGDYSRLMEDLRRADSGLPDVVYAYRIEKLELWLRNRPRSRRVPQRTPGLE